MNEQFQEKGDGSFDCLRMEKSHSKRHELSFYGLVRILVLLIAP